MEIQNLGELNGPVWIYGGVYSNLQALDAFCTAADAAGIPASNRICTGDIVAYCGDPSACVDKVRAMAGPVLAGNCEKQLAQGADDCGCGFDVGSTCSVLSQGWYAYADAEVSMDARDWMRGLPDRIVFRHNGKKYAVVHGGASDISEFLWCVTPKEKMREQIILLEEQVGDCDRIISGHSGITMNRHIGRHLWQNAGAIGMPANDGSTNTSYMVLEKDTFEFKRLKYDVDLAVSSMRSAGLTQGYHDTLKSGWWPSEEILPVALRRYSASG